MKRFLMILFVMLFGIFVSVGTTMAWNTSPFVPPSQLPHWPTPPDSSPGPPDAVPPNLPDNNPHKTDQPATDTTVIAPLSRNAGLKRAWLLRSFEGTMRTMHKNERSEKIDGDLSLSYPYGSDEMKFSRISEEPYTMKNALRYCLNLTDDNVEPGEWTLIDSKVLRYHILRGTIDPNGIDTFWTWGSHMTVSYDVNLFYTEPRTRYTGRPNESYTYYTESSTGKEDELHHTICMRWEPDFKIYDSDPEPAP